MTDEEYAIVNYLQGIPGGFAARKEIARKAAGRGNFEANPRWVDAPLQALLDRGQIEQNDSGQFRLKQKDSQIW